MDRDGDKGKDKFCTRGLIGGVRLRRADISYEECEELSEASLPPWSGTFLVVDIGVDEEGGDGRMPGSSCRITGVAGDSSALQLQKYGEDLRCMCTSSLGCPGCPLLAFHIQYLVVVRTKVRSPGSL